MKHNWEYKKLGEVCVVSAGQGAPQGEQNYCEKGTPFIKAGNLEDLVNGLDESNVQKVSQAIADKHKLKLYKAGSVIFAKSGMSCMKGYVHVLQRDCFVVNHLAVLTPTAIKGDFLKYYLWYSKTYSLVKDEAYPSISLSDIAAYHVPLPPLPIQQKIVAELDKVSLIIDKKRQQLKELDKLAQAIFYDMFGDPVENEKGWEVNSLNRIALLKNGLNFGKVDEGVKVKILGVSDFQENKKISSKEIGYTIVSKEVEDNFYLKDNDLVFVRSNGSKSLIGRCVLINTFGEKVSYSGFCIRCRIVSDKVIPQFLLSLMQEPKVKVQLICGGRGCNIQNINQENLGKQPIILPPLSLQQSFAAKIEAIEKQKELISRSIKEAQTLFDERMDYWFN